MAAPITGIVTSGIRKRWARMRFPSRTKAHTEPRVATDAGPLDDRVDHGDDRHLLRRAPDHTAYKPGLRLSVLHEEDGAECRTLQAAEG